MIYICVGVWCLLCECVSVWCGCVFGVRVCFVLVCVGVVCVEGLVCMCAESVYVVCGECVCE